MIALFSPSEDKHTLEQQNNLQPPLQFENFSFLGENPSYRHTIIQNYIQALHSQKEDQILSLFGIKTIHLDTLALSQNLLHAPCIEAIRLYKGVAYEALDFEHQIAEIKHNLLERVVIFSNLFGPVKAKDPLPFYRLKQGSFIGDFKQYYANFTHDLHHFCADEDILDLRAEFYQKLYTPHGKVYRPYFYKNNKRLSHYAKAYRGYFLKQIASAFLIKGKKGDQLTQTPLQGLKERNFYEQKGLIILEYDIDS